ncbi:MAG: hypothetical protein MJ100_07865 [Ruminococcus sp.]|nr:hypothetical protein [Ruminococcus sp.]
MNKDNFDLKSLENADNPIVEKLVNENMLDDAEKDRIFRYSMKEYSKSGKETTISGVETYKKSNWRKLLSTAAVLLLVAGLCGGTAVMLNRGTPVIDDTSEEMTTNITTENKYVVVTSVTSISQTTAKSTAAKITGTSAKSTETKPVSTETADIINEADTTDTEEQDVPNDNIQPVENTEKTTPVTTIKTTAPIRTTTAPPPTTQAVKAETTAVQTTAAPQTPEVGYTNSYLYMKLNSLEYRPYSCDGLPEYVITFPDGTTFYLNLSSKWVQKGDGTENEAVLPDDLIDWINTYGYPTMTETTYMDID